MAYKNPFLIQRGLVQESADEPLHETSCRSNYFSFQPEKALLMQSHSDDGERIQRPLDDFDRCLLLESSQAAARCERQNQEQYERSWPISLQSTNRPYGVEQKQATFLPYLASNMSTSSISNSFSSPTIAATRNAQRTVNTRAHKQTLLSSDTRKTQHLPQRRTLHSVKYQADIQPSTGIQQSCQSELPVVQGIELVPTSRLPDQQRLLFSFPILNAVQSKCFNTAYRTDDNLVVSAPTGSGKTVIFELAICRMMQQLKSGRVKVVYQAPTKSLCTERHIDWQAKFSRFQVDCMEMTGDTEFSDLRNVAKASIIITTPEKWDSITRKWKDNAKLMAMVRLFLIDEVHILKDARGATLEAIVSRMKSVGSNIRLVALSATIPNSEDVATWLGRNEHSSHLPAEREVFDDSFRPVQLQKHIIGHKGPQNPWAFDSALSKKIPEIVAEFSKGKPVMVFCPTKESTAKTADALAQAWLDAPGNKKAWSTPKTPINIENDHLYNLSQIGVAFHNASLNAADRKAVEQGFLRGDISIMCSTSTLAVGVNLPCYLVILKGTVCYTDQGLQEYSCMEVMQMLGRAGRPQFETEAAAVILCQNNVKSKYERMTAGEEVLESSLHLNLIEHFNAEIGIGTVTDMRSAKQWLRGTFLYVRLQQNSRFYGIEVEHEDIEETLARLCEMNLQHLHDAGMIEKSDTLSCTVYGEAMARYCIKFKTMRTFMQLADKAKVADVLDTLSQAEEFKDHKIRMHERTFYKELNQASEIRYPFNAEISSSYHKISLLLQAKLACVVTNGKSNANHGSTRQMQMDTFAVLTQSKRMIRCMIDVLVHKQDSNAVKSALELARCLAAGLWDDTVFQLKQIPGIGDVFTRKLSAAGIKSITQLLETEPQRIDIVCSKTQPFGMNLVRKAAEFPRLHISLKQIDQKRRQHGVEIKLRSEVGYLNSKLPTTFNGKQYNVLFLCETDGGKLVDFRRFSPQRLHDTHQICLTVTLTEPTAKLICHTMCDEFVGTHSSAELDLNIIQLWFTSEQPRTIQRGETVSGISKASSIRKVEDFHIDDLDDADLLAAAKSVTAEEIVEDIDDIMNKVNKDRSTQLVNHSAESLASKVLNSCQGARQLENGRWECQHDCKDKGVDCKHKCCSDGVKNKPKRRQNGDHTVCQPSPKRSKNEGQTNTKMVRKEKSVGGLFEKIRNASPPPDQTIAAMKRESADGPQSVNLAGTYGAHGGRKSQDQGLATPSEVYAEKQLCLDSFDSDTYDWDDMSDVFPDITEAQRDDSSSRLHKASQTEQQDTPTADHVTPSLEHITDREEPKGGLLDEAASVTVDNSPYQQVDFRATNGKGPTFSSRTRTRLCLDDGYSDEINHEDARSDLHRIAPIKSNKSGICTSTTSTCGSSSTTYTTLLPQRSPINPTKDVDEKCAAVLEESKEERNERLYIEDQKKRWARIDSKWLTYENFGHLVNIVD